MATGPIYLLRHGETTWNRAGRLQGHLDSKLTQTGRAQARRQAALLAPILSDQPQIEIFTSPSGRAVETARLALQGTGRFAVPRAELREVTAGSWDGMYLTEIERDFGALYRQARNGCELMFLSTDGEGPEAVLARASGFLKGLTGSSILVTHGDTLSVLRGLLRGLAFDEMLDLDREQGCVYVIENGEESILR